MKTFPVELRCDDYHKNPKTFHNQPDMDRKWHQSSPICSTAARVESLIPKSINCAAAVRMHIDIDIMQEKKTVESEIGTSSQDYYSCITESNGRDSLAS